MKRLLIDSGALLAMIDTSDQHHAKAAMFVRAYATATFYLPDTIFAETMVLVKAHLGTQPAIELGNRMMHSKHFSIVSLTDTDKQDIWNIFSRYTDKEWSYVDCSILAIAHRLRVFDVFAFDHHFDQMVELRRLPSG